MSNEAIDIFITSHNRKEPLRQTLEALRTRTHHPHRIHVFDNGSMEETRDYLYQEYTSGGIHSLILSSDNTKPYYPKPIFHSMVESSSDYYVVTDSDILPPDLGSECWLTRLLSISERKLTHTNLAILSAQVPPVWLYRPYGQDDEVVYCHAVGNMLKLVNRHYARFTFQQRGMFGDDELLCTQVHLQGYRVGYARNVFAQNIGQKPLWGYASPEEYADDPRKASEPPPLFVEPKDPQTFELHEGDLYAPQKRYHNAPPPHVTWTAQGIYE